MRPLLNAKGKYNLGTSCMADSIDGTLVIEFILFTNIFKDYLKHKVYLLENFSSIDCAW